MEYSDLPPMTPGGLLDSDGNPNIAALPESQPPSVEEDVDELDDTAEPVDGEQSPEDSDEGVEADAPTDEVAQLREKLRQAEERAAQAEQYEAQWAEQQRVQQQQAAEAYWHNAQSQAEQWFTQREAAIYHEAQDAIAPVAYVEQQMRMLNQQRVQWFQQFHAQREQSLWQFAMQQALPNYAAEVADHYHLPRERVAELLTYPPDLIPREAERMARERDERARERRKASQAAAKKKKAELSENATFPGGGAGGMENIELGSEEHYLNMGGWQRVGAGVPR